jgi:WD40 repeat protein
VFVYQLSLIVLKIVEIDQNGKLNQKLNLRVGRVNLNYGVVDLKWHPTLQQKHIIASAPTNGAIVLWNLNKKGNKMGMK